MCQNEPHPRASFTRKNEAQELESFLSTYIIKSYHAVNATGAVNTTASLPPNIAAASPNTSPPPPLQGTMVLQLLGELGNNLSTLAYYFAVRTIASFEFNLNLTLHVRKQKSRKAASAARHVKCLRSFRDLDFDECDWDEDDGSKGEMCRRKVGNQGEALYDLMRSNDNRTVMKLASSLNIDSAQGTTSDAIRSSLRDYVAMLKDDAVLEMYRRRGVGWTVDEPYPFLYNLERISASDALIDEFHGRGLPEYFALDDRTEAGGRCCAASPDEDEHVFHHRAFVADLPKRHMAWGGAELRPERAAALLAASLPPGTRVAVVGGGHARVRVAAYADAFRGRSFAVRAVVGQSSIQDFCFLTRAQVGLWGTAQSSYLRWASLISGGLRNATLYGVNYPARDVNVTGRVPKNEDLARIVHYPVFDVPDEDVW